MAKGKMIKEGRKMTKEGQIIVSGKRKQSVARAVIIKGSGIIKINKRPYKMLPLLRRLLIEEPVRIAKEKLGSFNFDISVKVKGGGQESQIEAARLSIGKAIVKATKSSELRKAFLKYDKNLLIADTRRKETCKPGDSKARKRRQKSYR